MAPGETPAVSYSYDDPTVPNGVGRLASVSNSASATRFAAYDALGRVTASSQNTADAGGVTHLYTFGYTYNRAGMLTSETYPSGRVISYPSYDYTGKALQVNDNGQVRAQGVGYAANGALSGLTFGNGAVEQWSFNPLYQPETIQLTSSGGSAGDRAKMEYCYYGTGAIDTCKAGPTTPQMVLPNNGNVLFHPITARGTMFTQQFGYDGQNRLSMAQENQAAAVWSSSYSYDNYGNRAESSTAYLLAALTPQSLAEYDGSTNRWMGGSSSYDAAGNQQAGLSRSFAYDGEGRMTFSNMYGANQIWYAYDGDGRRVGKFELLVLSATSTDFRSTICARDAFGNTVAEYCSPDCAYGALGTTYYTTDGLGSTRVETDAGGNVKRRYDYLPFGQEIPAQWPTAVGTRTVGMRYQLSASTDAMPAAKFTGKERDAETGLDYFGARYLSGAQGRFTSPDPLLSSGKPWEPQSWNRYSYVLNNPLRYTDPIGLYVWDNSLGGDTTDDELRKNYAKKQANQIIGRRNDIRNALAAGAKISDPRVQAAIAAYGAEGNANGVAVAMGKLSGSTAAQVSPGSPPVLASADGTSVTANMLVTFDFSKVSGANDLVVNAAHEGQHMLDRQTFIGSTLTDPNAFSGPLNLTTYQTEVNAYTTGAAAFRALNPNSGYSVGGQLLWNPGWAAVDRQALDKMLAVPKPKGSYGVTPQNPGSVLYPK